MTAPVALTPAVVQFRNGVPYSPADDDIYCPEPGRRQPERVFMAGNGLPQRWQNRQQFVIVETGFGGGHNFLATWAAWRADPLRAKHLVYVAFEHRPWTEEDLRRAHADRPHAALADSLRAQWPLPCRGPHLRTFEQGHVQLLLWLDDAEAALPQAIIPFDAAYLDGFSPDRNPSLWSAPVLTALAEQARPGATLASYTVAAPVRKQLTELGATVTRVRGSHKRVVLHGRWNPHDAAPELTTPSVAVLGAGLAGTSVARALAEGGVNVTVYDSAAHAAAGASGAPRMVVRPWLARIATPASQLSRHGFLHAVARYAGSAAWRPCGVAQWLNPEDRPESLQAALRDQGWPQELLAARPADPCWLDAPLGGSLDPGLWCAGQLEHPLITQRFGAAPPSLAALRRRYDAVVLACAAAVPEMLGQPLPLRTTRGQLSQVRHPALAAQGSVRCGDGYVAPTVDGQAWVGATYERGADAGLHAAAHLENLKRLQRLTGVSLEPGSLTGGWRGERAAWPDRLPAVGAVPGHPDTWLLAGLASRGAVWAPLLGAVVAAQIRQQPVPLPADLLRLLQPHRLWPTP
jgi:tRNA 5-methylaminomethyl-2-thiouridine biosynthesis bifunctional protein